MKTVIENNTKLPTMQAFALVGLLMSQQKENEYTPLAFDIPNGLGDMVSIYVGPAWFGNYWVFYVNED